MDLLDRLASAQPAALNGSVVETAGMMATVADFPAPVGALVEFEPVDFEATGFKAMGQESSNNSFKETTGLLGEVIGFRGRQTMVSPYGNLTGIQRGRRVRMVRSNQSLLVGNGLLGRVVNALGKTIDGLPKPSLPQRIAHEASAPAPLNRPRINTPLHTGVRAIDGMLTCGKGQRLGIFAGSGVGKSTMLGMMARYSSADVIVIGLVGERGREVNEFIERDLGPTGLARSVVVVATSNEPPLMRLQAASTATAIAEHFRDEGKEVLLMIDSVTRTALASRELGLAAGEPPTTRGYPPSTFAMLPRLVERAGKTEKGSITAFYSVLVEGDDPNEPIADTMRGLLDGHIWLNRKIASRGIYPSIDMTQSISRLMTEIASSEHQTAALLVRRLISALEENEDLISIGAYRAGTNRILDAAIALREEIQAFLGQAMNDVATTEQTLKRLLTLAERAATLTTINKQQIAPNNSQQKATA